MGTGTTDKEENERKELEEVDCGSFPAIL